MRGKIDLVRLLVIVGASVMLASSLQARAELVEVDWIPESGDRALTRDTRTNLDWLDLTVTEGRSMNQILSGYGGWVGAGFRYATVAEVRELFSSAGLAEGSYSSSLKTEIKQAQLLINLLGSTYASNPPSAGNPFGQQSTYGVTGDRKYIASSSSEDYTYGWIDASDSFAVLNLNGQYRATTEDPLVGSFLVRPVSTVPEPGTYACVLAGLGMVGAMAWRRKQARASQPG